MSTPDDDPLHWLAMRYVLDELSSAEREEFEERLVDDVAACEAVANAARMKLLLLTTLAESASVQRVEVPRRQARSSTGPTAVAMAVVTVCCALLAVGGFDIAHGWLADGQNGAIAKLFPMLPSDSAVDAGDDTDEDSADSDLEVEIPGWMLAGVILEKHGTILDESDEVKDN